MKSGSNSIIRAIAPDSNVFVAFRSRLDSLLSKKPAVVLAIDGRAASGKSSLAASLAEAYKARVVHMDDFFLPAELRTAVRLAEPGGNLHVGRFVKDVLPSLHNQASFCYQAFDCKKMTLGEWRVIQHAQLTIVEGAYALHPKLGKYYDLALFMSCSTDTQLARVQARNPDRLDEFKKRWIPLEEAYFEAFGIQDLADFIIQT